MNLKQNYIKQIWLKWRLIKLKLAISLYLLAAGGHLWGWTCGIALLYHFLLQPIIIFALSAFGISFVLPSFDMGSLMTVLMGMLGLGGLRTFEKTKGVAR